MYAADQRVAVHNIVVVHKGGQRQGEVDLQQVADHCHVDDHAGGVQGGEDGSGGRAGEDDRCVRVCQNGQSLVLFQYCVDWDKQ